ncbi:MAG: PilN domain-containing protein [Gemmatimonadetes bacterium]|nr:PilN domain-containing protein [Gemmatimonadota bacterium]
MIRINLLPGPQKRRGRRAGLSLPTMGELSKLLGRIKDPLLIGVIAAWAVVGAVVAILYFTQAAALVDLKEQERTVQNEARRFRNVIAQKRRVSESRDSLVAELEAIREIDADRFVWPHILEEVTKALPDFTWLVSLEAIATPLDELADSTAKPPVVFQIDGRTSDVSAYTRFVSQLARSPWVRSAEFGALQSVLEDERPVQAFTVTVTYQTADSAYIRAVPLQASVR